MKIFYIVEVALEIIVPTELITKESFLQSSSRPDMNISLTSDYMQSLSYIKSDEDEKSNKNSIITIDRMKTTPNKNKSNSASRRLSIPENEFPYNKSNLNGCLLISEISIKHFTKTEKTIVESIYTYLF